MITAETHHIIIKFLFEWPFSPRNRARSLADCRQHVNTAVGVALQLQQG